MGLIKRLPETVQNKIAAGEVVERPASVVKELVENALDAGARNVSVELEGGGHRLIRVADDGSGMSEDDLLLSAERHATSKIRDVDDIFSIHSLGFRGEALPSIASVSRTLITSALPDAATANQLEIEAGKIVRLTPAPKRRGTLVEVRDIFFNTPARRKFLKSPGADNSLTAEVLIRLALAYPHVGFRLQVDGLITLAAHPAADQLERIGEIFGSKLAKTLLPLRRDVTEGLSVGGFISPLTESRPNQKSIYLLVNRRWIKSYKITSAMAAVFKSALPARRYPFAIVNLEINPELLDVNVHPTKEEIRFANEDLVVRGVGGAVKDALRGLASQGFDGTRAVDGAEEDGAAFGGGDSPVGGQPAAAGGAFRQTEKSVWRRDIPADAPRAAGTPPGQSWKNQDWSGFDVQSFRERVRSGPPTPVEPPRSESSAEKDISPHASGAMGEDENARDAAEPRLMGGETYRVLGQVMGKFILVEGPKGLYFIDPHALHERWNFDRLKAEGKRGFAAAKLLLPIEIRLTPAEAAIASEAAEFLSEHGFALALREPTVLEVGAAPSFLKPKEVETLIRNVLADVDTASEAVETRREQLLASLACRSSVLLGKTLPEEELSLLIDRFLNGGQLPTCPHGRPTGFILSMDDIAKRLGR